MIVGLITLPAETAAKIVVDKRKEVENKKETSQWKEIFIVVTVVF